MDLQELKKRKDLVDFIQKMVKDERFLEVKDAFVSHTPEKDSPKIALGKFLGTRYVFNELERIANYIPVAPRPKKKEPAGITDPDLTEARDTGDPDLAED